MKNNIEALIEAKYSVMEAYNSTVWKTKEKDEILMLKMDIEKLIGKIETREKRRK